MQLLIKNSKSLKLSNMALFNTTQNQFNLMTNKDDDFGEMSSLRIPNIPNNSRD